MAERIFKIGLVGAIALFFSFAVLNNLTDAASNFAFVQHVLSMDTIFPNSTLTWRAITHPAVQWVFYGGIIGWEGMTGVLGWIGVVQLLRSIPADATSFNAAKFYALLSLTASSVLWLVAFWDLGGEWFAMWQSPVWNGQPIAFRMFMITSMIYIIVRQPDTDLPPEHPKTEV